MIMKTLVIAAAFVAASADASEYSLEPCINGGVSSNGQFPSQEMEDQVQAYLEWKSSDPYYLFSISASSIDTPFEEDYTAAND